MVTVRTYSEHVIQCTLIHGCNMYPDDGIKYVHCIEYSHT